MEFAVEIFGAIAGVSLFLLCLVCCCRNSQASTDVETGLNKKDSKDELNGSGADKVKSATELLGKTGTSDAILGKVKSLERIKSMERNKSLLGKGSLVMVKSGELIGHKTKSFETSKSSGENLGLAKVRSNDTLPKSKESQTKVGKFSSKETKIRPKSYESVLGKVESVRKVKSFSKVKSTQKVKSVAKVGSTSSLGVKSVDKSSSIVKSLTSLLPKSKTGTKSTITAKSSNSSPSLTGKSVAFKSVSSGISKSSLGISKSQLQVKSVESMTSGMSTDLKSKSGLQSSLSSVESSTQSNLTITSSIASKPSRSLESQKSKSKE